MVEENNWNKIYFRHYLQRQVICCGNCKTDVIINDLRRNFVNYFNLVYLVSSELKPIFYRFQRTQNNQLTYSEQLNQKQPGCVQVLSLIFSVNWFSITYLFKKYYKNLPNFQILDLFCINNQQIESYVAYNQFLWSFKAPKLLLIQKCKSVAPFVVQLQTPQKIEGEHFGRLQVKRSVSIRANELMQQQKCNVYVKSITRKTLEFLNFRQKYNVGWARKQEKLKNDYKKLIVIDVRN
ncbi:Hypothetical_protein [Hexamita inflata]|uniref:Hypothetical_protein n=1 Tax=Hexamita inflata TaxID=28002 RepID=A0AA86NV35_9EUKA|nr:Hypothetical protein HINF_LOCUS14188 [Hexamita inflata]